MKNREEIVRVLSEKTQGRICAYCGGEIKKGFYADDGVGKNLIFPKPLTKHFVDREYEILIHYACVEPLIFDMMREGGDDTYGTTENTKVLIRY